MKKVLLDTSVLISAFGAEKNPARVARARAVIGYLESNAADFQICYSRRTPLELTREPLPALDRFEALPYHSMNEKWEQVECTWDTWGTKWGDVGEVEIGDRTATGLPDGSRRSNRRDRGIFGDAVMAGCSFLLHENPRDFDRLREEAEMHGLVLLDLLVFDDADEAIRTLATSPGTVAPSLAEGGPLISDDED